MKHFKSAAIAAVVFLCITLIACSSNPSVRRQQTGLVVGGASGAIIGNAVSGGSAVGTGVGAVGGALVGSEVGRRMN